MDVAATGGAILRLQAALSREVRELASLEEVPVIEKPTALEFLRHASRGQPVLMTKAAAHWKALTRWTDAYLTERLAGREVTVAVTPTGYADAVHDGYFVRPHEERKSFGAFLHDLHNGPEVHYVQLQNSNLTLENEFAPVLDDVDRDFGFATEALGVPPEAVNVWIGNHLSTTWVHKDPYENLCTVISGEKHFTLFPPCDYPWLYERDVPTGQWVRDPTSATSTAPNGLLKIVPDKPAQTIPWIAVDPDHPDLSRYPKFAQALPLHVTVRAGETLYIPALFYHHVRQSDDVHGRCIAVNMWYDMDFDVRWAYNQFVQQIAKLRLPDPPAPQRRGHHARPTRPVAPLVDPPSDDDDNDNEKEKEDDENEEGRDGTGAA